MSEKTLDVVSGEDANTKVSDVQFFGNPDMFKLLCKASSKSQGWMKSTKACQVEGGGCVVQVTTQQNDHVAEALTYVPNCIIETDENGVSKLVSPKFDLACCAAELQESPDADFVEKLEGEIQDLQDKLGYSQDDYLELHKRYQDLANKYFDSITKYSNLADEYCKLLLPNE